MAVQISGIDLHYLCREFQVLVSAKVEKIYQLKRKDFIFNFHVANRGRLSLRIMLPELVYLTQKRYTAPEKPFSYTMFLRKRLRNARVREISQTGLERVMRIVFETKEAKFTLFLELFSRGNMILCDEEHKIIQPLERQSWRDREIRAHQDYVFPKGKTDLFDIDEDGLKELMKRTNKDRLVTFLAIDLGLGGKYSEFICRDFGKDISPKDFSEYSKLVDSIKGLLDRKPEPVVENKDVYPFRVDSGVSVGSLSEAFDDFFEPEVKETGKTRLEKLKDIIKNQEEHISKLEADIS